MKKYILVLLAMVSSMTICAATSADYKIKQGKLHEGGKVHVQILPDEKFKVQMTFAVTKKKYVPVPEKLLKGETTMEFPDEFRTEKGYQHLEQAKVIDIPKARLQFVKRVHLANFKTDAYLLKVLPTNKKTEIEILYHPSLPSVGWEKVDITFISKIPVLNGYEVKAELL